MAATPLEGADFVNAVRALATLYRLDPIAVFASAVDQGIDGVIDYNGTRYGPWDLRPAIVAPLLALSKGQPYVVAAQDWAWSNDGVSYAVIEMANKGGRGLTGHAAVDHIVTYFETPADLANEITVREATYDDLLGRGSARWAYLAGLAGGPSTFKTPAPPTVAELKAESQPYVNAAWRDLLTAFSRTGPSTAATIDGVARRIPHAVK